IECAQRQSEQGAAARALQDVRNVVAVQRNAAGRCDRVRDGEAEVLGKGNQQQEEDRQREADERILHRMDRQALQYLKQEKRGEGQADEEEAVLHGALDGLVEIHRLDKRNRQAVLVERIALPRLHAALVQLREVGGEMR